MNIDLSAIGSILKNKREEQGFSILHVSDVLCIRKSLIEAIETGNEGVLPHPVYLKGFIRAYAAFLGVTKEVEFFLDVLPEKTDRDVKSEEVVEPPPRRKRELIPRRFPKVKIAAFSVLIIVMCFFVYDRIEKERALVVKTEDATRIAETTATNNETKNVLPVAEVNQGKEIASLPVAPEPKRLMITCNERTWVSVVIDGAEKKEFMMSPQEIVVLNAKEGFDLLIGNAGGVKLVLNGKDTEFTGKSGEVKRLRLS